LRRGDGQPPGTGRMQGAKAQYSQLYSLRKLVGIHAQHTVFSVPSTTHCRNLAHGKEMIDVRFAVEYPPAHIKSKAQCDDLGPAMQRIQAGESGRRSRMKWRKSNPDLPASLTTGQSCR
jgi:hypothetical protein